MTEYLWTNESAECVCGHHLLHHHTLLDGVYLCTVCVCYGTEQEFHEFLARKQPLMEVRPVADRYLKCDKCFEFFPNKMRLIQHQQHHAWQENNK